MRSPQHSLAALVALILVATPGAAQQSQAQHSAANTTVAMKPTHPKWTREQVMEAQRGLAQAKLYRGKIDGVFGRETESAIREYQKARQLTVNGQLSDDLLARLRAEASPQAERTTTTNTTSSTAKPAYQPEPVASGVQPHVNMSQPMPHTWRREEIIAAQEGLTRAKLYHGATSGTLDPSTVNAIREFQRLHGLPVTGELSDSLLARLRAVK